MFACFLERYASKQLVGVPLQSSTQEPEVTVDARDVDFAHTEQAARNRRDKALGIARYVWDRNISGDELLALSDSQLKKLARAAGAHPPRTIETWTTVAELLREKAEWAEKNPNHPAAARQNADEKIMWVKPAVPPWLS